MDIYTIIPPHEKGIYLSGLLKLIKIGRSISDIEKEFFLKISQKLGYDKTFCMNALTELLINRYIDSQPVLFKNIRNTKAFIIDGLQLSILSNTFYIKKLNWLLSVAQVNSVNKEWIIFYNDIFLMQSKIKNRENYLGINMKLLVNYSKLAR